MNDLFKKSGAFFELLRCGLWGGKPQVGPLSKEQWRMIMDMAKRQTVLGLMAPPLSAPDAAQWADSGVIASLRKFVMQNIMTHLALDRTVAALVSFYRQHGIEGVLLKGQGVARYYPKPELRQCGDVDFYICGDDFERAMAMAVDKWQDGKPDLKQETYKHYHFDIDSVEVELHRIPTICLRPWMSSRFNRWLHDSLSPAGDVRRVEINGAEVLLPSEAFDAFYIFYHILSHLLEGEGIGLRQLCDWAMVLHRCHASGRGGDVEAVIKRFGLTRPWQIVGYLLVEYLGLPSAELPLYSPAVANEAARLMRRIMSGGNFGQYSEHSGSRRGKGFWGRKFETFKCFNRNLIGVWYLSPTDVMGSYLWYTTTGLKRAIVKYFALKK